MAALMIACFTILTVTCGYFSTLMTIDLIKDLKSRNLKEIFGSLFLSVSSVILLIICLYLLSFIINLYL